VVDEDDGPPKEARPAGVDDLVALCRSLNREGARYQDRLFLAQLLGPEAQR